jgi:hypothetical protein
MVRRCIEAAKAANNGKIAFVALDWKKAFDSIKMDAMTDALRRYGDPQKMLSLVARKYSDRRQRRQR